MSRIQKNVLRLLSRSKHYRYNELKSLLEYFGYREATQGKTSGSRVAYVHISTSHIIRLHKPHPSPYLKSYQINYLINELALQGYLAKYLTV